METNFRFRLRGPLLFGSGFFSTESGNLIIEKAQDITVNFNASGSVAIITVLGKFQRLFCLVGSNYYMVSFYYHIFKLILNYLENIKSFFTKW